MYGHFFLGAFAFQRQHPSPIPQQRQRPIRQLVQGSDGARGRHVELTQLVPDRSIFGPTPHDDHRQPQLGHRFPEEVGPPEQRFDEGHAQPRARKRERDPREPGTAPDVGHSLAVVDELCHRRTI
jgi:hypothetical protein